MSNRPLPVIQLPDRDPIRPVSFDVIGWFSGSGLAVGQSYHGLSLYTQSASAWQQVVSTSNPGVLLWAMVGARNNDSVARSAGLEITINGITAMSKQVSISAGQSMIVPGVGLIALSDVSEVIGGCSPQYVPYESGLTIRSYAENISVMDVLVAYWFGDT